MHLNYQNCNFFILVNNKVYYYLLLFITIVIKYHRIYYTYMCIYIYISKYKYVGGNKSLINIILYNSLRKVNVF